jgi:fructose/tagatose bisphosphate aldolase
MECSSLADLMRDLEKINMILENGRPSLSKSIRPTDDMLDRWARTAALGEIDARQVAIWAIREAALAAGVIPASVQDLYLARAQEVWSGKTVPAMNLRGWSYQTCRSVFRAAKDMDASLFIFEQAVGEAIYAAQPPAEYTAAVLAAALREGYTGPVFLQADHDQVDAKSYTKDKAAEVRRLEEIMRKQIDAGFFNIDIDASTVVDLSLPTVEDQQRLNAEITAHFTRFVREIEPEGVTISLGAEIGEVGHENTTPEELRAFMATYGKLLKEMPEGYAGVSKISINSGTYHGGKVLPDGTLAQVNVDYDTLRVISDICRREFNMGGAVQHGASTLPGSQLAKFPETGAVEIHLALGFNNLIFDHPSLPDSVKDEIKDYVFTNHLAERAPGETDAQFLYNVRKKSWKIMKQRFWDLPPPIQDDIMLSLQGMFRDMFTWMNVGQTRELVLEHTTTTMIAPEVPDALTRTLGVQRREEARTLAQ